MTHGRTEIKETTDSSLQKQHENIGFKIVYRYITDIVA